MSQQRQQQPFLKNSTPPSPAPCPVPEPGGCCLINRKPKEQSPCCRGSQGQPPKATRRRKPRCLQGDIYYHCKEEEC